MKRFLKIDFSIERTPDATTLLHFRHLLEKHDITRKMFDDVKEWLDTAGLIMHGGTIVDATIIHAPSSTKGSTDKFSTAILTHLFCPHNACKSST